MPFTMTRRSGMASEARDRDDANLISKRVLIKTAGIAAGGVALAPRIAGAQAAAPMAPPSTITTPPRDFGPNAPPNVYFTDPDVLTIDPLFDSLRQPNAPIQRLWTGALWSEGPAWSGQGRYLVWSDIPNNRQMRWLEDNGRVTVFRMPSNNSNGNTFDFQGRQLSCEHLTRRVVRYEHNGSITVIAERFEGKRLNSPNDVVPHPDGSYWFTDPPYGGQLYEGAPDAAGGPSNAAGRLKSRRAQAEPPLHGGQPVTLRALRRDPGRVAGLSRAGLSRRSRRTLITLCAGSRNRSRARPGARDPCRAWRSRAPGASRGEAGPSDGARSRCRRRPGRFGGRCRSGGCGRHSSRAPAARRRPTRAKRAGRSCRTPCRSCARRRCAPCP